jgi:hypothetical protein
LLLIAFRPKQRGEEKVSELLNKSVDETDETSANAVDEYAVIQLGSVPVLPPRPHAPRGAPLNVEQWEHFKDKDGCIVEVERVKDIIFRGVSYIFRRYSLLINSHWYRVV